MAHWDVSGRLFKLARKVEDIFQLQEETKAALRTIDKRLHELKTRMTHLEADRGQMITEAKAAAGLAASGIASAIISDAVTRITRLEVWRAEPRVLPPPGPGPP